MEFDNIVKDICKGRFKEDELEHKDEDIIDDLIEEKEDE